MDRRPDLRAEEGQTAVEFALVLPILTVLLLAVIQLGIAFNNYVTITDAARAGARKAIVVRIGGGTSADAVQTVRTAAGNLDQSKLDVTVSGDFTKPGSDVIVTAKYPYTIDLLGWVAKTGSITSTMTERLE